MLPPRSAYENLRFIALPEAMAGRLNRYNRCP
ncbi:hypothetical protein LMG23992_05428 [Cupriavidus laharis]|uniref:Uncharacterized protein n=1 Tax=Cupriavidus laharis TaxID=151654 RepID=A0ABN7ZM47_9BURK|nr:hypothetical protein LMG23992_05428 [Cupriavidus laharis]